MVERVEGVDVSDVPTKPVPRHTAHSKHIRHRAVHILVFDEKGNVFVQLRSRKKDRYPNYYEASVSGHVLAGDRYEESALRELKEEIGITVTAKDLELKGRFDIETTKENEIVAFFVVRVKAADVKIDREEVEEGTFVPLEQLRAEIKAAEKRFTPGTFKAIELFSSSAAGAGP